MADFQIKSSTLSRNSDLFTSTKSGFKFDNLGYPKKQNQFDMAFKATEGLHHIKTETPSKVEVPSMSSDSGSATKPTNDSIVEPKSQHIGTVKWYTWLLHGEDVVRKHIAAGVLKKCLQKKKVSIDNPKIPVSKYLERKLAKATDYYQTTEQSKMFANAVSVREDKQIENPTLETVSTGQENSGSDILQHTPLETSNSEDDLYTFYYNLWTIQTKGKALQKSDPEKESLINSFSATEARRDNAMSSLNRIPTSRDATLADNLENGMFVSENVSGRSESNEPYLNAREYISEVWRKNREAYSYLGDDNPFLNDPPDPGYLLKNFGSRERINEPKNYNNYAHNQQRKQDQINSTSSEGTQNLQPNLHTNLMRETPSHQRSLMNNQPSHPQQKEQFTISAPILELRKRFLKEDQNYDSYSGHKGTEGEATLRRNQPLNQCESTIQPYFNPWGNPTTNSPFSVNPYYMAQNATLRREEPTQDWTPPKFSESFDDLNRRTHGPTDPIPESRYKYHLDGYQYPVDSKFQNYPNPTNYGMQQHSWKPYQPRFSKSVQDSRAYFPDGERNEYAKFPSNQQNRPEYYYGYPEKAEGYNYPWYERSYPYSGSIRSTDTENVDNRFYEPGRIGQPMRDSGYPEHFYRPPNFPIPPPQEENVQ